MAKCVDCHQTVYRNDDGTYSEPSLFRTSQAHSDCLECGQVVVCHFKGICRHCDTPVHAITEYMSVGSCGASYDPFELIFNLNYPENFVRRYDDHIVFKDGKCICSFGIIDHADDAEYMQKVVGMVAKLLPSLRHRKLLIHSCAGFSRSVVVAAAMLALLGETKTVSEGVNLIRRVRTYVGPNEKLMNAAEHAVARVKKNITNKE